MNNMTSDGIGNCICNKCNIVRDNILKNKWCHYTNKEVDSTTINNYFHKPLLDKFIDCKPEGCIWFSAGSWLFDPYCDGYDGYDGHDFSNNDVCEHNVITVENPINILEITNLEKLLNFNKEYKKCKSINWKKIIDDRYYGVAFTFRKYYYLKGYDKKMKIHPSWQLSFDVESLCIFDLRAIDGLAKYFCNIYNNKCLALFILVDRMLTKKSYEKTFESDSNYEFIRSVIKNDDIEKYKIKNLTNDTINELLDIIIHADEDVDNYINLLNGICKGIIRSQYDKIKNIKVKTIIYSDIHTATPEKIESNIEFSKMSNNNAIYYYIIDDSPYLIYGIYANEIYEKIYSIIQLHKNK